MSANQPSNLSGLSEQQLDRLIQLGNQESFSQDDINFINSIEQGFTVEPTAPVQTSPNQFQVGLEGRVTKPAENIVDVATNLGSASVDAVGKFFQAAPHIPQALFDAVADATIAQDARRQQLINDSGFAGALQAELEKNLAIPSGLGEFLQRDVIEGIPNALIDVANVGAGQQIIDPVQLPFDLFNRELNQNNPLFSQGARFIGPGAITAGAGAAVGLGRAATVGATAATEAAIGATTDPEVENFEDRFGGRLIGGAIGGATGALTSRS
jgi:hypothetical protein